LAFQLKRGSTGEELVLHDENTLGTGGEATVYSLPSHPSLAAKVYLKPSPERAGKLVAMTAHPPAETSPAANPDIAWPTDLLWTTGRKSQIAGFLMPRVEGMAPIIDIYSPHTRITARPWFDYQLLLKTCVNLAEAVETAHRGGYVIGDLNHSNVLVADDARVTLIDTDSFQVRDQSGQAVFLCPVYTPEFTAPELHAQGLIKTERSLAQDSFGLAVLTFLMLMGGVHPFAGVHLGKGEVPPLFSRIASGDFPYSRNRRPMISPAPVALPFETLAPPVQDLFRRCFEIGHDDPSQRPTPVEWRDTLLSAEQELAVCETNTQHRFSPHQTACPWCIRTARLGGRDPFPSSEAVLNGLHKRPIPVRRTLPHDRVPGWRVQERQMRRARVRTPVNIKTWQWAALVSLLWVVLPGMWALSSFVVSGLLAATALLAAIFYGMTAAMVPVAAGMVGWRSVVSARRGGGWIAASVLGLAVGSGLIGLTSVLAFY